MKQICLIQSHFSVCFFFESLKGLDPWCCRKYPWNKSVAGSSLDIMCCHGAKDIPLTYKIHVDMYEVNTLARMIIPTFTLIM